MHEDQEIIRQDKLKFHQKFQVLLQEVQLHITIRDNGGKIPQVISEKWNAEKGEYVIEY